MARPLTLCLLAAVALLASPSSEASWRPATPPPLPVPPIPSAAQLRWQRREVIMFFHFGMNTFTGSEWGNGTEPASLFHPTALDAAQWMDAARGAGASLAILVAKHHDGFCLWPSAYTAHSVRASPWRGGRGDVVGEFARAAGAGGLDAGIYLSPWDRHDERYGKEAAYNEYYEAQLRELLTGYGSVSEIWFDGAKGKNATNMTYHFQEWFQTVRQLQRSINIFSDAGPDVRWVGDEKGFAGTTCWSTVNRSMITIGEAGIEKYLNEGDPRGRDWVPPECDVSIRPGWFWHSNETAKPLSQLLEIYYNSVGRNCVLLLNAPPNTTGLVEDADVARLREFGAAVATIFGTDLAAGSAARASSERGGRGGGFAARNVLDGRDDTYWAPARVLDRAAAAGGGGGDGEAVQRGADPGARRARAARGAARRVRGRRARGERHHGGAQAAAPAAPRRRGAGGAGLDHGAAGPAAAVGGGAPPRPLRRGGRGDVRWRGDRRGGGCS